MTTGDRNKIKVYTDGFDGHCLRAYYYFFEDKPNNFNPDDPESINSIEELHKDLRQESKAPTFALTYQGTAVTLVKNCGFEYDKAKTIYSKFHELYKESDIWVENKLEQGKKDGYVNLAFGHRIKTPLLKYSSSGRFAPYITKKEFRTVANALGQSYCMLTGFTSAAMYREIHENNYSNVILPVGEIHDATYWRVINDEKIIKYAIELMKKTMGNHGLKELEHPQIKIDIDPFRFNPTWAKVCKV